MNSFVLIAIFLVVLFLYLHIYYHVQTSNEMDIYEIGDDITKDKFEDLCKLKQPILIHTENENLVNIMRNGKNVEKTDVNIRNMSEKGEKNELYLPLNSEQARTLFEKDVSGQYISMNNSEFIEETKIANILKSNEGLIKPPLTYNAKYDILWGSNNSVTPFSYSLQYRNYLFVSSGECTVILSPPKYKKQLKRKENYEYLEFNSEYNPFEKDVIFDDNVKTIKVPMMEKQMLFIPPYWFYSVKMSEKTKIVSFQYSTIMNNLAIFPQLCLHLLQNQNIKFETAKKVTFKETVEIKEPDEVKEIPEDDNVTKEEVVNTDIKENNVEKKEKGKKKKEKNN